MAAQAVAIRRPSRLAGEVSDLPNALLHHPPSTPTVYHQHTPSASRKTSPVEQARVKRSTMHAVISRGRSEGQGRREVQVVGNESQESRSERMSEHLCSKLECVDQRKFAKLGLMSCDMALLYEERATLSTFPRWQGRLFSRHNLALSARMSKIKQRYSLLAAEELSITIVRERWMVILSLGVLPRLGA